MHIKVIFCLVLLHLVCLHSYKILMLPVSFGFNSRLLNVQKMADILSEEGHDVTVLLNSKVKSHVISKKASILMKNISNDVDLKLASDLDCINEAQLTISNSLEMARQWFDISFQFCDQLLQDEAVLRQLKNTHFDLIVVDIAEDCGRILLDFLGRPPSIIYNNFGFLPETNIFYPMLTSICCSLGGLTCSTDEMAFHERVFGFLMLGVFNYVQYPQMYRRFQNLKLKHGIENVVDVEHAYRRSIQLINGDFTLEYPRPLMPSMVMIAGLFQGEPKPLPTELEKFILGSAPHGVILLSFGTHNTRIEKGKAEMMARVFGSFPQRVIWRYLGQAPDNLSNNTMLTKWFPQNDVLGHPLTRVFISHCGISGVYEAAYNAVPVVATPLFFDQHYNAGKLVHRAKMGVHLNFERLTENDFSEAIHAVLDDPTYKQNALKISKMLHDQVVSPRQKLLHLAES